MMIYYRFILKIFLFIVLYNEMKEINCTGVTPWFIHDKYLYYASIDHRFDGNYARAKCIQLGMIMETTLEDAGELMPALKEKYGEFPFLWVYENAPLIHFDAQRNMCLKLGSFAGMWGPENCSSKLGFICKCSFNGATLFHKNGTIEQITKDKVQQYCDPHSNDYDDILDYCMINLVPNLKSV